MFINLSCPNCGGKIEQISKNQQFTCQYCGSAFIIDDKGDAVLVSEHLRQIAQNTQVIADTIMAEREKEQQGKITIQKTQKRENAVGCFIASIAIFIGFLITSFIYSFFDGHFFNSVNIFFMSIATFCLIVGITAIKTEH